MMLKNRGGGSSIMREPIRSEPLGRTWTATGTVQPEVQTNIKKDLTSLCTHVRTKDESCCSLNESSD